MYSELGLLLTYSPEVVRLKTVVQKVSLAHFGRVGLQISLQNAKCLGDVFSLPMNTVIIVEDLTMEGMAVMVLFSYQIL